MNKWIKRGLVVGAVGFGAIQSAKYLKQNEQVKQRLNDLKNIKEYNDLRIALMEVIEAFNNPKPQLESKFAEDVHTESNEQPSNAQATQTEEPLIADAVKRVLDTKVVEDLLGDKADIDMMKSLVDETKEVEKLVRSWFN
ncbi:hypothetical protein CW676_11135 [Macrococcoides caseolyticum]|uniref:hypothetical protein n=1 Tax=Macrococcoides caseolyticum TaxID=69966 RepID=UPI000C327768|nr:hypothetical protein [Macrococcus caseolyticus]PKE05838.1 hypothetical protein CW692_11460 [Macrococcus caseolyticus]PKE23014.1 hypothetical protein CW689_11450 [Macrococcus caseolyticus]PKE52115.1 hypothetical protein CW676_11135 [Macrococcus caseolyticus]PKF37637.1 hypothetical protein CW681_11060 [Macrococcus caseolyticus]PKF44645.1 hypothetical protein CW664_09840 [Macrococcus caseolyticus]